MVLTLEILSLRSGERVEDVVDPSVDVDDEARSAIAAARVRSHVAALPERERNVIVARFGLGGTPKSHHTIARELHVAVGTVLNIEQRALTMLRMLDAQRGLLIDRAA